MKNINIFRRALEVTMAISMVSFEPIFAFLALFVTFMALLVKKKYVSHVRCNLPPVTNANSDRPSPAKSPIILSRLVLDKTLINHGQITLFKLS